VVEEEVGDAGVEAFEAAGDVGVGEGFEAAVGVREEGGEEAVGERGGVVDGVEASDDEVGEACVLVAEAEEAAAEGVEEAVDAFGVGVLLGDEGGGDLAPGVEGAVLAQEVGAADAAEDEVEAAVREGLVVDDAADAEGVEDGGVLVVVVLVAGLEDGDAEGEVALKEVLGHGAVAWLEDVEREQRVWEEHGAREREDAQPLQL
jgi:hypothetical protein